MIDTHTHLYMSDYENGGVEAVERALKAGVNHLIMPGVEVSTLQPMFSLYEKFPNNVSLALGLHPTEVKDDWQEQLTEIFSHREHPGVVAVGEVGMDLYWDKTYQQQQMQCFEQQVNIANEQGLPLIIHCREALPQALEVLGGMSTLPPMVFHSFTGKPEDAEKILEVAPEAMFGINGVVTFKNAADVRQSLHTIGLERIVLETDAPWLAPVPHRGKRNESAYIPDICAKIADELGLATEEVAKQTTANARRLFKLKT